MPTVEIPRWLQLIRSFNDGKDYKLLDPETDDLRQFGLFAINDLFAEIDTMMQDVANQALVENHWRKMEVGLQRLLDQPAESFRVEKMMEFLNISVTFGLTSNT